jgi:hypothetical protein
MSLFSSIEAVCNFGAAYFKYKTENLPSREERLQLECEDLEDEIHGLEARGADADMRRAAVLRLRLNRRRGVLADLPAADVTPGKGGGSDDAGRPLPDPNG